MTKLLIVEDEPSIAADIADTLKASGMAVEIVRDGEAAWFAGDVENYDAAILDLGLPDMDGVAVLERLREWSNIPVLVLSVRGHEEDKIRALDHGANDYITKPFSTPELLARLRR
jgi:DNA-binding response OmpR family regulator